MTSAPADSLRGASAVRSVPQAAELSHTKYRADIDGLRAIAVLSVIGFHAFPYTVVGGFIGVDIFFVISGFLISTIILENVRSNSFSYAEFYRRRVRRIFPALIVVLLSCLLAGWAWLLADEYTELGKHILAGIGFVSNFKLWSEAGYFNASEETKPLLHLWSLAIEEQFYIVWPVILGIIWKRRWNFVAVVAVLMLLSFAVNVMSLPAHVEAAFYSPLSRFWELMVGGMLAYVALYRPAMLSKYRELQSALGLLLLGSGLVLITRERAFPGWWALLPTFGSALLISAGPATWGNRTVLSNKLAVWFGKISYPLYLWHWPLLSLALILNNSIPTSKNERIGLMLLAVLLARLTYQFVEIPIRGKNKLATPVLVGAFLAIGVLASTIVGADGLPRRAVNQDEARLFLDRYLKLKQSGVSAYFQERCDFYDWATGHNKGKIDDSCTAVAGSKPVFLLWGDSHMQALSYGFRKSMLQVAQIAQIATSGCKPEMHDDPLNGENKAACQASNEFAMAFIKAHKPARVFVAQRQDHDKTDWAAMAAFVRANQGELVLLGPVPQWFPSLPAVASKDLKSDRRYIGEGLDPKILSTDALLRERYGSGDVHYVSLVDKLCQSSECLAKVPSDDAFNLLVMDYGHLTPAGSVYVVQALLPQLLPPPLPTIPKS